MDCLKDKWGIGQSERIAYIASISDLLDFSKFNRPPASVLQNFAVAEVYVKRAQKCLAKDMRSNWTTELDIETLNRVGVGQHFAEVKSVIPFHMVRYESVLENCMTHPASVRPGDITFATRFVAAYVGKYGIYIPFQNNENRGDHGIMQVISVSLNYPIMNV